MQTIVEICDVSFYYKPQAPILQNIHLKIQAGEFVTLLGSRSSGKSTLAKLLAGFIKPSQGSILLAGWDTQNEAYHWQIRQNTGILFQNPQEQLIGPTVRDEILFGPENLGLPAAENEKTLSELLDLTGLAPYAHESIHHLSGGQKQKLALAATLAMHPKLLILDEAFSMLDMTDLKNIFEALIHRNKTLGTTIIHITRNFNYIGHAHRVLILHEAKILRDASPLKVFDSPEELLALSIGIPKIEQLKYKIRRSKGSA